MGCEMGSCLDLQLEGLILASREAAEGPDGHRGTPPGVQPLATEIPSCKGCCYLRFINKIISDWAESCFTVELYLNPLQLGGVGQQAKSQQIAKLLTVTHRIFKDKYRYI